MRGIQSPQRPGFGLDLSPVELLLIARPVQLRPPFPQQLSFLFLKFNGLQVIFSVAATKHQ